LAAPPYGSRRLVAGRDLLRCHGRAACDRAGCAEVGRPEGDLRLPGPALFDVAELPDRPDGKLIDILRKSIAVNLHAVAAAHGEPAGTLAGGVIRVMD